MTTVPPPTTLPVPTAVPASAAPVVLILAPPAAVAALPAGAPLAGVVLPPLPQPPGTTDAPDARAIVTVRTPAGDITLRLPAPLPPGTGVELQVVRASPDQATLRLVTVNDQPAAQVLAQLRQAAAANAPPHQPAPQIPPTPTAVLPPANAWTPQGPVALPALGALSAYVVQGAPLPVPEPGQSLPGSIGPGQTATAQTPPFTLATGGELAVRVTSIQLPSGEPPMVAAPPPAATPLPAVPIVIPAAAPPALPAVPLQSPPTPPPLTPSPLTQAATPQTPAAVTAPVIVAATAPTPQPAVIVAGPQGLPPAPPAPPRVVLSEPPQAVLTGVVVRGGPDSPLVIATGLGEIQLNVRANLPAGTRVTFEVIQQLPPQAGAAPPPLPMTALPLSGPPLGGATVGWPNLSEALVQLQRADPAAAAQFAEAVPDGGPRTLVAIVAFAQAMRSGDSRSWPGDSNLRALENLGPRGAHLARQIGDEVKALAARTPDGGGSDWRAMPVPWNAEGRIDRITLITRREGDPEDAAGGKKGRSGGTRFLVNLDLSRLGPLQLDGLFRKETRGLEVMIRTKQPLPDPLRLQLTGIFGTSAAAMGLTGALSFQVVRKFPDPVGHQPNDKSGVWA